MALGNGSGRRQREACDMRCSERGGVCDGSGRVPGVGWLESCLLLSVRPCWQPSYCLSCYTSILLLYLKVIVILVLFSALVILMCMALMFKILV